MQVPGGATAAEAPEEERVRRHTQLGFEMLRHTGRADILAPRIALEHHEHQDGTGLPRGLEGSNAIARKRSAMSPVPTLIGEIAAIANRRFIERRYEDIYSGEDPPYQDPPVLPSPQTSGGIG